MLKYFAIFRRHVGKFSLPPDETHEDAAHFSPAPRPIWDESLALVQSQVAAELQRELVLLVESQEGLEVQLS